MPALHNRVIQSTTIIGGSSAGGAGAGAARRVGDLAKTSIFGIALGTLLGLPLLYFFGLAGIGIAFFLMYVFYPLILDLSVDPATGEILLPLTGQETRPGNPPPPSTWHSRIRGLRRSFWGTAKGRTQHPAPRNANHRSRVRNLQGDDGRPRRGAGFGGGMV